MEWSILFMGPVGSGKTQAIRSISDIDVLDTDVLATDETQRLKSHTTVSMDVGTLHLVGADKLRLYGAPGQDRFDFMWDILLEQSKGVIQLINHSSADPLADLEHYLKALEERTLARRLPVVIGVTHVDTAPHRPMSMYRDYLQGRASHLFDAPPPILEMDARDKQHVRAALIAMTALLEMTERFPKASRARE